MKNIHVLPTDKPSRLWFHKLNRNLGFSDLPMEYNGSGTWVEGKNIYITSDEEIKDGDWVFDNDANQAVAYKYLRVNPNLPNFPYYKKIILTTDDLLIKDGVQAINDDFLEWFVKNPSCEFVGVDKNWNYPLDKRWEYKIIIPQEEPKQETLESNKTTAIRFLEWYRRKGVIYQFQAYHIQGSDETIYLNADQLFEIFKKELYEK
jgi:hypothetical protein